MARRMYDAAYAPSSPPAWEVVAGYIGGNAVHVWSDEEWASQSARYRLPIFVRSNPEDHVAARDAAAALARLRQLGMPHGCAVALDLETAVNPPYVKAFDAALVAAGYVVLAYGSAATIFSNPRPSGGYWAAHYTGEDHMEPRAVATQWASDRQLGKPWDVSTVADSVPLWDTREQEDDMAQVSSLGVDGKQTIAAGKVADVKFATEYTDKHNLHGENGLSVVIAPDSYWVDADAIFELRGLAPGERIDVAWTRVGDDGTFINDAWRLPYTADTNGVVRGEIGGQFGVDETNRLRLRVYNTSAQAVTVVACMAKASLFKF